jgi:hypothetical protein
MNQPGVNIYDRYGHQLNLSGGWHLANWSLKVDYFLMRQDFLDEYVLHEDLSYQGLRQDWVHMFQTNFHKGEIIRIPLDKISFGLIKKEPDLGVGLQLDGTLFTSNQNYLDVSQGLFIKGIYDYWEFNLSPTIFLGKELTLSYLYSHQNYFTRNSRNILGEYISDPLKTDTNVVSAMIYHPLGKRFSIISSCRWQWATSNMDYTYIFYTFNYNWIIWTLGIKYEY